MFFRNPNLDEINRLDPYRDFHRINTINSRLEFPWDAEQSLRYALFKTFAFPGLPHSGRMGSGTHLLVNTGEFLKRTQKRIDDTVLILLTLHERGLDTPDGRAALRRMNQMHGRYAIPNEEMLYTLSAFVLEPIRWNARFGWRKVGERETTAALESWRTLAGHMNIRDVPATLAELNALNRKIEQEHMRFHPNNLALAEATMRALLGDYLPQWLHGVGRAALSAVIEPHVLAAIGWPQPPRWLRAFVERTLRARGWLMRWLPRRRQPVHFLNRRYRSYPNGYKVGELGT
jgi:hypothetical protein